MSEKPSLQKLRAWVEHELREAEHGLHFHEHDTAGRYNVYVGRKEAYERVLTWLDSRGVKAVKAE